MKSILISLFILLSAQSVLPSFGGVQRPIVQAKENVQCPDPEKNCSLRFAIVCLSENDKADSATEKFVEVIGNQTKDIKTGEYVLLSQETVCSDEACNEKWIFDQFAAPSCLSWKERFLRWIN